MALVTMAIISSCLMYSKKNLFDHNFCSIKSISIVFICLYCKYTFSFQFCGICLKNRYGEDVREALLDKVACTDC